MSVKYFLIFFICALAACSNQREVAPRPHQFPKVLFPTKSYVQFQLQDCPFSFKMPNYSSVSKKQYLFENIPAGKCWFDLELSEFDATIHFSYYSVNSNNRFDELVNDAFTMASKHNIRASFREEKTIENLYGSSGVIFDIKGPVATPYQFFISDTTSHFLRGSLYFNQGTRSDSLAPIIDFLYEDIEIILSSLSWQN